MSASRPDDEPEKESVAKSPSGALVDVQEHRTPAERDYDRILFSTPVRRLADKTQVFPLEQHDSVRTRLTHSLEVSNLARSFGMRLADLKGWLSSNLGRQAPAMLAAAGLCHDIGNPPFGHQGEAAIQRWFEEHPKFLDGLSDSCKKDFLKFEGNAQTFRLMGRLQHPSAKKGLDLTFATLASFSKYPCFSDETSSTASTKKHGVFQSERDLAEKMWAATGLRKHQRHPFAYIVEACDDICYAMIDAEDTVKKSIASIHDLLSYLEVHGSGDDVVTRVVYNGRRYFDKYRVISEISSQELNEVTTQRVRVDVIGECLQATFDIFVERENDILSGTFEGDLIKGSRCARLIKSLKEFDRIHGYSSRAVKELELEGARAISKVMTALSEAVVAEEARLLAPDGDGARLSVEHTYLYSRISEGYRRSFEESVKAARTCEQGSETLPPRYFSCQLLTDAVAGMTDGYLLRFLSDLRKLDFATQ